MNPRALPWALAIVAGLVFLYLVTAYGNFIDCYNQLIHGEFSGFHPNDVIRQECRERTLYFPFSFFQ